MPEKGSFRDHGPELRPFCNGRVYDRKNIAKSGKFGNLGDEKVDGNSEQWPAWRQRSNAIPIAPTCNTLQSYCWAPLYTTRLRASSIQLCLCISSPKVLKAIFLASTITVRTTAAEVTHQWTREWWNPELSFSERSSSLSLL
jgi:hypothetical protein